MELLRLTARKKTDFWPTGAVMIVVLTVISAGIGIWRIRNEKKGIGGPGKWRTYFEGPGPSTGPLGPLPQIRTPAIPPDPPPKVLMPGTTREVGRGLHGCLRFF
ncbi:hypothetical protein [Streptomyces ortus]|uniref:Uncharacterized protein n=1 Tax=Streptomyces ortus TaxID=2867268 RepID=A0ABT3VC33_9ACTN|nr:hypothetical protein [Streptomyces ortus]MCX4236494.1 hypothetical protein [Streptomyces ortus]